MTISVEPHTITRTIPRYRNAFTREVVPERSYDEVDVDFPYLARSGSVSAIGRTREGATAMVERILANRAAPETPREEQQT